MQGLSNFSEGVDMAFFVIIGISLVFLIGLTTLMIYLQHDTIGKKDNLRDHTY